MDIITNGYYAIYYIKETLELAFYIVGLLVFVKYLKK